MATSPAPAVLNVKELAALLRMGRRQTYEAIHRGEIPGCHKIGGSVRCSKVAIHTWLDGEIANLGGGDGRDRCDSGRTSLEVAG